MKRRVALVVVACVCVCVVHSLLLWVGLWVLVGGCFVLNRAREGTRDRATHSIDGAR